VFALWVGDGQSLVEDRAAMRRFVQVEAVAFVGDVDLAPDLVSKSATTATSSAEIIVAHE